jgi:two-component system, chemotaxis family, CheB/CheR fusion protein
MTKWRPGEIQQASAVASADFPGSLPSTQELFGRLRRGYGVGLEAYRSEALRPQLEHRMSAVGLSSLDDYLEFTTRSFDEFNRLLDALLIGSTSFHRDPLAFDALGAYLPQLGAEESLRAWVAGCSTGEEAYTVAMVLLEHAERHGLDLDKVRVFATDLRASCLTFARRGQYRPGSLAAVPLALRDKYFVVDAKCCKVRKRLRAAVCFGQHDLLSDPPFAKLHLISCRNVLLYLQTFSQRDVLTRLHYGLVPKGTLLLGPAESPAAAPGLFQAIDREHRLYGKLVPPRRPTPHAEQRP